MGEPLLSLHAEQVRADVARQSFAITPCLSIHDEGLRISRFSK
jgi:hypothetical protein